MNTTVLFFSFFLFLVSGAAFFSQKYWRKQEEQDEANCKLFTRNRQLHEFTCALRECDDPSPLAFWTELQEQQPLVRIPKFDTDANGLPQFHWTGPTTEISITFHKCGLLDYQLTENGCHTIWPEALIEEIPDHIISEIKKLTWDNEKRR